ncbi:hypothetical protein GCM10023228_11960 [Brevibacillus fulvus]
MMVPLSVEAESTTYVVQQGDTLYKLSREFHVPVEEILQQNQLTTDKLSIGQVLQLSGNAELAQDPGESLVLDNANVPPAAPPVQDQPVAAAEPTIVTADILHVRAYPSLQSEILGNLSYGTPVEIKETGDEWCKIEFQGQPAYVAAAYLGKQPKLPAANLSIGDGQLAKQLQTIIKPVLNTPYVYGGTTPAGFDCSGFTSYVFQQLGIKLPRTSAEQFNVGQEVDLSQAQPGDLLFYDTEKNGHISHVALYMGNGTIVHATGVTVKYEKVENMQKLYPFYGVKRIWNPIAAK